MSKRFPSQRVPMYEASEYIAVKVSPDETLGCSVNAPRLDEKITGPKEAPAVAICGWIRLVSGL